MTSKGEAMKKRIIAVLLAMAMALALGFPVASMALTTELIHVKWSYSGSAVSYTLYQEGSVAHVWLGAFYEGDATVDLIDGENLFTLTGTDDVNTESPQSTPYSLTYPPPIHTVSISAGSGGTVLPIGNTPVTHNNDLEVFATPDAGHHVASAIYNDGVEGLSLVITDPLVVPSVITDGSLSIAFAIDTFSITLSAGTGGNISGPTTVDFGSTPTYLITPPVGSHVSDVLIDGESVGAVGSYTFPTGVSANHTISASFAINTYVITASAGANGSITPSGKKTLNYGGSQAYNITPGVGYHINTLSVNGSPVSVNTKQFGIGLFKPGTTTFSLQTATGTTTTVLGTATDLPIAGDWDGDGVTDIGYFRPSTATFYQKTAAGITTIQFGVSTDLPIIGDWDGNGKDEIGVFRGSNATFYLRTAIGGYTSVVFGANGDKPIAGDWDGNAITYQFQNISKNNTISATFAIDSNPIVTHTITASAGANGTITPNGVTNVVSGNNQLYTITPEAGYHTANVLVDGASVAVTDDTYTFPNVTTAHTISVTFAIDAPLENSDIGYFRPSTATFYLKTASGTTTTVFGTATDLPIAGDWDGNGVDEIGYFRPSTATFYLKTASGTTTIQFGAVSDLPVIGDWDGNGVDEIGVFRPSNSTFYQKISTGLGYTVIPFGTTGDKPIAGDWE